MISRQAYSCAFDLLCSSSQDLRTGFPFQFDWFIKFKKFFIEVEELERRYEYRSVTAALGFDSQRGLTKCVSNWSIRSNAESWIWACLSSTAQMLLYVSVELVVTDRVICGLIRLVVSQTWLSIVLTKQHQWFSSQALVWPMLHLKLICTHRLN